MKLSARPCLLFRKNLFILKGTVISFIIDKVQVMISDLRYAFCTRYARFFGRDIKFQILLMKESS
ncbi:MAG: hypothetical protein D3925_06220 [Candidatus Electrothrix sp. AR5]|nr:hypothetical protein [Candidatus Electrothrix sp. AR5]